MGRYLYACFWHGYIEQGKRDKPCRIRRDNFLSLQHFLVFSSSYPWTGSNYYMMWTIRCRWTYYNKIFNLLGFGNCKNFNFLLKWWTKIWAVQICPKVTIIRPDSISWIKCMFRAFLMRVYVRKYSNPSYILDSMERFRKFA